jgi:hypothetical protein
VIQRRLLFVHTDHFAFQDDAGEPVNPFDLGIFANILWYFTLRPSRRASPPHKSTFGALVLKRLFA